MSDEDPPIRFDPARLAAAAREHRLRLVVLYGSYASRRADSQSDLDIAVLGCSASQFWECYQSLSDVFSSYPLDMVRLEGADPMFRHEIMHAGIRLYGDEDSFYEYRAFAYRDFVESADLFALEEALFQKTMDRIKEQLYGPT